MKAVVDVGTDKNSVTVTIKVSTKGRAQRVAARAVMRNDRLKHNVEHLVGGLLASNRPAARLGRLTEYLHQTTQGIKEDATRTKEPRSTIGVSSVIAMRQEIARRAEERDVTYAVVARESFDRGLEALEARLWDEPSKVVLGEFAAAYSHFGSGDTAQWSLRVSREAYLKALLLAKEYGLSQSNLACGCIAIALGVHATA